MRSISIIVAMMFYTTSAISLTTSEINAALATVSKSSDDYRKCLLDADDGELVKSTELRDVNGDGVAEILLTESGTSGGSTCFGRAGQNITLLVSNGAGGWNIALNALSSGIKFIKRDDNSWPDIEIAGPGFCFPIWRMQSNARQYEAWKACEQGRLVQAQSATPALGIETITIGTKVAIEIYTGPLDGVPYDHNGSIVTVDAEKGLIVYAKPKRSIGTTIKPGTVLFRGKPWKDGDSESVIKGTAYVFKQGCPAAAYDVRGIYHSDYGVRQFTLEGAAPMRSKKNCDIVGHSLAGSNAKLRFDIAID